MNWLSEFVELAAAILQKPEDSVRFANNPGPFSSIIPAFAAFSLAAAGYLLRDYYEGIFLFTISFHASVLTLVYVLFASLTSAVLDARVQTQSGRSPRASQARRVLLQSLLPLIFAFPAATIAHITPVPGFVFVPLLLLLYAWAFITALRSLQYLYELSIRDIARQLVISSVITLAFPAALVVLLFVRLAAFL